MAVTLSVDDLNTLVWRAYARGRADGFEAGHDAAQDLAATYDPSDYTVPADVIEQDKGLAALREKLTGGAPKESARLTKARDARGSVFG